MDHHYWENVREEFPVTNNLAYFNSAGMSPIPIKVLETITKSYENLCQYGDKHFMAELQRVEFLKERLARMIHTSSQNICFASNTSTAFTFLGAALKRGMPFEFNLVSLYDEFPSTNIPFEFQGIPVKFVKPVNGSYSIESIANEVDDKTMGVVVSHVQYATGFRLDLKKLGDLLAEMDLLFIVNATQSFPFYPIHVQEMQIDALSVSFHKWGLSGINGSLFFTSEGFRESYPNPMAGWLGVHPPSNDFIPTQKEQLFEQLEDAGQYNFGTSNIQTLAGLDTAMSFMEEIGLEKILDRVHWLRDYLIRSLKELPVEIVTPMENPENMSPIVLIRLQEGDSHSAVSFLQKHNISTSVRAGGIRIACNFFNNRKDIDQLINTLQLYLEL